MTRANVLHASMLHAACIILALVGAVQANNEIFPATGAAKSVVTWKDGYFCINGKPTFLTSGEMHFNRIPRELWRDRIWRMKQMGFNCMQMYVFWNVCEPSEGKWDFTENNDLDAWLSLLQEMGMYATVRVGPYSCAEWDNGGIPPWLMAKPGVTLRDGGIFEQYATRQLDQVEKIVATHQIQRGGNVILVQLENEHPRGWGTDEGFPYLKHIVEQARDNGLEVPLFLSGLHHNADPSGENPYKIGESPWFTTEFWTGWIGKYGDMDTGMLAEKIRGTWKIIAFGGAGYDYYMIHGGTNFGYSGFSHDATYDYAAPIGETGRFNNFYWHARRAAYFARSFATLLTDSHNDPDLAHKTAGGLRVTARTSPAAGSIVILDAFSQGKAGGWISPDPSAYKAPPPDAGGRIAMRVSAAGTQLPEKGTFCVTPIQPHTVLLNIPWTDNASFSAICTNVILRQSIGGIDYWVCYGDPEDAGEVRVNRHSTHDLPDTVQFTYPADDSIQEIDIDSGDGHHAKLLVMNTQRTERTWLAHEKLYIGPAFVMENGQMEFGPGGGRATIYSADGKHKIVQPALTVPEMPSLGEWTWRDAARESAPDARTDGWLKSTGPREMASYDGFANRYGWYRTMLHRDSAGPVALHFSGQKAQVTAFLNGKLAALDKLDAQAGDNTLAILVKGDPRPTLYNITGSIGDQVARGLWGSVSTDAKPITVAARWMRATSDKQKSSFVDAANQPPDTDAGWQPIDVADGKKLDLGKGPVWLRGTFDVAPADVDSIIDASGFPGSRTQRYINGQSLRGGSVDANALVKQGENVLMLRLSGEKPLRGAPDAVRLWHNDPLSRATWFFHGGLGNLDETAVVGKVTNWNSFLAHPWQNGAPASPDRPVFWHSTFNFHRDPTITQTFGLSTEGLKSGHVWLNGHNLGESPQKVLLYLPECWIKDGPNDLVIFDMLGAKPDHVRVMSYESFAVTAER